MANGLVDLRSDTVTWPPPERDVAYDGVDPAVRALVGAAI